MKEANQEFLLDLCDEGRCATNDLIKPTHGDRHDMEFAAPAVIDNSLAGNFPSSARHVPLATVSAGGTYGREASIIAEG